MASYDNAWRLWDVACCEGLAVLTGHERVDSWAASDVYKRQVVTASFDKTARLWAPSAAAGGAWVTVAELEGVHTRTVRHVSWSPCGTFISGHHHYGRPSSRGESQT